MLKLQLNKVRYIQNVFSVNDKIPFNCKKERKSFKNKTPWEKNQRKSFNFGNTKATGKNNSTQQPLVSVSKW